MRPSTDATSATPGAGAAIEIVAISGSLRNASWARSLVRATAEQLPVDIAFTIWDGLGEIPLFNEDLESGPTPAAVADLRMVIERSDAVLVVTPEYNQSVPGVLKNALDWASRPYGQTVFKNKLVAVVGTSPLPSGGASALADVAKVLTLIGADVVDADLAVSGVHTRFDSGGRISDPELSDRIRELLAEVVTNVAVRRSLHEEPPLEAVSA